MGFYSIYNKKFIIILFMLLLLTSFTTSYFCINQKDNQEIKKLKSDLNLIATRYDIQHNNLTQKQFEAKLNLLNQIGLCEQ